MYIIFITPDGNPSEVDVPEGTSLMQAAVFAGVDGIIGDCGGSASCATCHVYVDPDRTDDLDPIGSEEEEALEWTTEPRQTNSRLSCQLRMTASMDGLRVWVANTQN
jgi:2Fe-2S ferredoxin